MGIGEYIHYSGTNYIKYGIYHKGKKGAKNNIVENYKRETESLKNRVNSLMNFEDKQSFEELLSKILSTKDNSKRDTELFNAIIRKMEEDFGSNLRQIDFNTLNVTSSTLQSKKNKNKKLIKDAITESDTRLNTILDRTKIIEKRINELSDIKTKNELKNKVNEIYTLLNQILTDGQKIGKLTYLKKGSRKSKSKLLTLKNIQSFTNEEGENVITIVNNLLKNADLFPANVALQKGNLLEYFLGAAAAQAKVEAGEQVENFAEEITKSNKGKDRSHIEIDFDKNNFTDNLDYDKISAQIDGYGMNGHILTSYGSSQNKLDVLVEWGGQAIPISAKNINMGSKYDVSIVSGTSLLYLLQDEHTDFVNHYFNIIAKHGNKNSNKIVSSNYKMIHELVKKIILFKGLTGKTFGRENSSAEIFIINDNKTGRIKIYDMKTLLEKAYLDIDLYSSILANGKDLNLLTINNTWSDIGAYNRITNFLIDVQKVKLKAALKKNIFGNDFS